MGFVLTSSHVCRARRLSQGHCKLRLNGQQIRGREPRGLERCDCIQSRPTLPFVFLSQKCICLCHAYLRVSDAADIVPEGDDDSIDDFEENDAGSGASAFCPVRHFLTQLLCRRDRSSQHHQREAFVSRLSLFSSFLFLFLFIFLPSQIVCSSARRGSQFPYEIKYKEIKMAKVRLDPSRVLTCTIFGPHTWAELHRPNPLHCKCPILPR